MDRSEVGPVCPEVGVPGVHRTTQLSRFTIYGHVPSVITRSQFPRPRSKLRVDTMKEGPTHLQSHSKVDPVLFPNYSAQRDCLNGPK